MNTRYGPISIRSRQTSNNLALKPIVQSNGVSHILCLSKTLRSSSSDEGGNVHFYEQLDVIFLGSDTLDEGGFVRCGLVPDVDSL